ncbi:hypothetical protein LDC_2780, partial [sediment metagenome]
MGSMLAVGYIIFGGVQYMTTDSFSGKSEGKKKLYNATGGLIFLIGGYVIFNQINPQILNLDFQNMTVKATAVEAEILDVDDVDNCDTLTKKYEEKGFTKKLCSGQIKMNESGALYYAGETIWYLASLPLDVVGLPTTSLADMANADKDPLKGCGALRDMLGAGISPEGEYNGIKLETSNCFKCGTLAFEDYCTMVKMGNTGVECKSILENEKNKYKCYGSCITNDCEVTITDTLIKYKYLSAGLDVKTTCQIGNGNTSYLCIKGSTLSESSIDF